MTAKTSDVKTVRYFVRPGNSLAPGTALASDEQLEYGGLVRQQLDRHQRVFAEAYGDQPLLESGQALIAPEVVRIEFRYLDGSQFVESWDMVEMGRLPAAIEVRIWIMPSDAEGASTALPTDLAEIMSKAHEYWQIVYLPMCSVGSGGSAGGGSTEDSDDSTSSNSSASSSSPSSPSGGMGTAGSNIQ
jgi:hypothetical protein